MLQPETKRKYVNLVKNFEEKYNRLPSQAELARLAGVSRALVCNVAPELPFELYNGSSVTTDQTDEIVKESIEILRKRKEPVTVLKIRNRTKMSLATIRRSIARNNWCSLID